MALLHAPTARAAVEEALSRLFGQVVALDAPPQRVPDLLRRVGAAVRDWFTEPVPDPDVARSLDALPRGPRWSWIALAVVWALVVGLSWLGVSSLLPPPPLPVGALVTSRTAPTVYRLYGTPSGVQAQYLYYWRHYADFTRAQCALLPASLRGPCVAGVALQERYRC